MQKSYLLVRGKRGAGHYDSSSLGRFMSPDDALEAQDTDAPQSWNLYSYVANNPTNAVDPDGHDCLFITNNALQLMRGDCSNVPKNAKAVTYVPGTVDEKSLKYDAKTGQISYSFKPYDTKAQIGRGQICCLKDLSVFQLLLMYRETNDPDFKRYLIGKILGVEIIPIPVAPGQDTVGPPTGGLPVPLGLLRVLKMIDAAGSALPGAQGGRQFMNDGRGGGEVLPQTDSEGNAITYREWDVNPTQPGRGRGAERIVTGSDGSAYYTPDHYRTFKKLR